MVIGKTVIGSFFPDIKKKERKRKIYLENKPLGYIANDL